MFWKTGAFLTVAELLHAGSTGALVFTSVWFAYVRDDFMDNINPVVHVVPLIPLAVCLFSAPVAICFTVLTMHLRSRLIQSEFAAVRLWLLLASIALNVTAAIILGRACGIMIATVK